jgi:hypothetical protein
MSTLGRRIARTGRLLSLNDEFSIRVLNTVTTEVRLGCEERSPTTDL